MQIPKSFKPFAMQVEMLIEFHMPIPASYSKRKRAELVGRPYVKVPDLSNMIKFYEDVFNGVLYEDDKLIVKILASKIHSLEPKTIICIREFHDENYIL